ncbi:CHAT domain-containing protein, partial [Mycena amicta]
AEAIGHGQEALTCLPRQSDWVSAALNLGTALLLQFDKVGGTLEDIDECISLLEEALKGNSADSPGKALTLKYLGRSYQLRFQNSGVVSDLHTAIQHLQESKAQCSSSNPRYSSHLTPLANVLRTRFNLYGESEDLEEAIQLCKRAVKIVPIKEEDRLSALLTLGHCLTTRFTHQGTIADLEESIQLTENALASMPTSYANRRQFLSSLARALEIRFRAQYGLPGDLHKAVDLHREALLMCAQFEVNYAGLISNLASGLHARFEIEGRPEDVTEAIELYQQSIELQSQASDSDKRLIPSYNNLAGALQARFSQTHNSSDIHKAVELLEKVVTMSLGTLDHGGHLANHGRVLYKVYMQSSNREYLEKAISAMKTASTDPLSPPLSRFDASNGWSSMAWRTKHGSALEAYRNSIQLLPQIAAIHLDLKERQKITSRDDVVALASDGAAYALDLHEYNTAVEFLEASRSVFWNQALNLRVGLGDLSLTKPELAQRFEKLAGQIEQVSFHSSHNNQLEQADDVIERSVVHRLSKEWDEVVHTIRSVSGFEGFLKTKQIAVLKKAAVLGPVVILNVNELSTVALIIQESHDILHVPLPDVIVDVMQSAPGQPERAGQIYSAVGDSDQRGARKEHQQQISPDLILYHQLADLWNQVAKPVLAALGIKKTENPTRLWWCPTGPFVFLPFHAAGIYEGNDQDCVSNYVISSYTPTLSALLDKPKYPVKALKMTAVIEPRAKNMRNLPGTTQERKEIASYVPSGSLTILDSPTKAEVLKHLAQSNIVHFACHGRQDTKNPLDSGLMLRDGRLTVSEIMQSRDAHRTQNGPSLAVLSACDTGKGDAKTPDEAMHIAATLLFAGFSSVVATMWPIHDDDGPTLTAAFYNHLFNKATTSSAEVPNLLGTAEALHIAVKKLRENPEVTFTRWVPFVHYG